MTILKAGIRWSLAVLLWGIVALCVVVTVLPHFLDRIYYRGPDSGHYDGARFFNPDGEDTFQLPPGNNRAGLMLQRIIGDPDAPAWPTQVAVIPAKPPARVEGRAMRVTWIGHASVLIQTSGLNILTDPVWSARAGPFGFGPRRVAEPGIRFDDLPPIDLVVVSHNHYDHMDLATLRRLWDRDRPVFITSLGNDTLLRRAGIPARGTTTDCGRCPGVAALDWGGSELAEARTMLDWRQKPDGGALMAMVYAVRSHHWGSRWFADRNRALWSAFVIRTVSGGNIFFAGDTGLGDGKWPAEAAALGPIRFAAIPIGAFRFAEGQMASGSHIGPRDAIRVWQGLGKPVALPIHWGTFQLSREGYATPPRMLAGMLRCGGVDPAAFAQRAIGQSFAVPLLPPAAADPRDAAIDACVRSGAFDALR